MNENQFPSEPTASSAGGAKKSTSVSAASQTLARRQPNFSGQRFRRISPSWILALLLLCVVPAVVQAQFTFTTNADGSLNISQYTGPGGAVTIPSTTNGLTISTIGTNAFYDCTNVTSVMILNSVTTIASLAFFKCTSLTNIALPNSITSVGDSAFGGCTSLTGVNLPNSVTNIEDSAFYDCVSLASVTIGTNVAIIGDFAFYNCNNLTSVTIPNSVTSIGVALFEMCSSLTNIALPSSLTSIGEYTFEECTSLTSAKIPNNVTNISEWAFGFCHSLTSVSLPNTLTSIGTYAFYSCDNLASVTIPDGVTNIQDYAFAACSILTSVFFQGNAPSPTNDLSVFQENNITTVYHLPGTTGWGTTFDGVPAILWNPQAQTGGANFGVQSNQFGFHITGTTNIPLVVEACTNPTGPGWTPLQSLTLTNGLVYFSDPQWTNYAARFYRLCSP
jgi:hypothetical protein